MKIVSLLLLLTILGPIWMIVFGGIDFKADYRTASRESSRIGPIPADHPEAIVQVYSARAFNWRGIFSTHVWLAIKSKDASQFTVFQVIGWRVFRGLPALSVAKDIPDRLWFNQKPKIIYDIRGKNAENMIPQIEKAVKAYPYSDEYITWPGPNSNTFIAYIGRAIPEMHLLLPSNAVGKDFTGSQFLVKTPSGTGYQLSIYGLLGITMAWKEGIEINLLGLVYGISPSTLTLKLPGFGDLSPL